MSVCPMSIIKQSVLFALLLSMITLTGCVTKQTTTANGVVIDEKYVVKRPVKKFIQTVEFE